VNVRPEPGAKPVPRSKTVDAKDKPAALKALSRWVVQLGDQASSDRITMARVFDAWFEHTAGTRTARANDTVRSVIDRHLEPYMGSWPVVEVDVGQIERTYARIAAERHLSSASMRKLHYVVKPSMRLAVRWRWIEGSPADLVELGKLRHRNVRPPDPADIIRLLDAADPEMRCFLWLCAVTGARTSEIAALRWGDIDMIRATITIHVALTLPKSGLALKAPKTDRSTRPIGIDFDTLKILEDQRARNLAAGADDGPTRFVFPDLRGDTLATRPVSPNAWSCVFQKLKKRVGVNCQLRDLRHYAATALLAEGVPVSAVSAMLGHARQSTTQDIYGLWANTGSDPRLAESLARRLKPAQGELPTV
jgi:integrase